MPLHGCLSWPGFWSVHNIISCYELHPSRGKLLSKVIFGITHLPNVLILSVLHYSQMSMNQFGNTLLHCFHFAPQADMGNKHCQAQNPIKNNRQSISKWTQTFCSVICLLLATYLLFYRKEHKTIKKLKGHFRYHGTHSNKATFRWFTCSFSATYGLHLPENAQTLKCSQTQIWRRV